MAMNSEALFSMALGLQPPWQVKNVIFSTYELAHSELHLHIDYVLGSRFLDDANN
jgi:transposase